MALEDNWTAHFKALVDSIAATSSDRAAFNQIAERTGMNPETFYQVYYKKSGKTHLGRKSAKAIGLAYANGRQPDWIDRPFVGVAHAVSDLQPIVDPRILSRDEWMTTAQLPDEFQLVLIDDALGDPYELGGTMRFSCSRKPTPRKPVLIEDREGNRLVRLYVVGRGANWLAGAGTSGYETLESERDGLRVLAVSTGYSWPDPA